MLDIKLFEIKKEFPTYTPTPDEAKKIDFVKTRFLAMQSARTAVDTNWDTYQTMINAYFVPYPDERSSSTVPLANALLELFVAEAIKQVTQYTFKAETSKFLTAAKAIEYTWKYDFRKNNRKKMFVDAEYICGAFGDMVGYVGFESYDRTQKDMITGDAGQVAWEEKTYKEEGIVTKNIDIRQFYVDNEAVEGIEDATDCIFKEMVGYEDFQNLENSDVYFNIDKVTPKQFNNDYKTFVTREEAIKQGNFVEKVHYWNKRKDIYMVIANGVIVREQPMVSTIDGKKELPFFMRGLGYKTYSIYHRGFCEAVMMFNSEINNLREMLMDGIRRSNSQVLALGNGLSFDGKSFSYDNEILTFDGRLGDNFQQISGNPPNQAIFNYITQLYKDIAIYVGIDIQNILGEPQQTAFQTEVQRESAQKRMNVRLTNRDLAYERFANLYKDALQTYFPRLTAEGLYPEIEIDGEELIGEGETARFRKKKGKSTFQVTPEVLRGQVYIDVHTNTNATTVNVVDREQKKEFLKDLGEIAQGYALAKQSGLDLEKIMPLKQTIQELSADIGLTVQSNDDQQEVDAAKQQLFNEIKGMMNPGQMAQPVPEGQPALPTNTPAEGQTAPAL